LDKDETDYLTAVQRQLRKTLTKHTRKIVTWDKPHFHPAKEKTSKVDYQASHTGEARATQMKFLTMSFFELPPGVVKLRWDM
jgi:hypothetical protein